MGSRPPGEVAMGESGSVSVHHRWLTVELSGRSARKLVFLDILVPCLRHASESLSAAVHFASLP